MKTDIEIAQEARMKPITQIAAQLGLEEESVIPYGRYKAKIDHRLIHNAKKQGKLILVTAISPTPAGEGKTTTSVGLADAMLPRVSQDTAHRVQLVIAGEDQRPALLAGLLVLVDGELGELLDDVGEAPAREDLFPQVGRLVARRIDRVAAAVR